MERCPNEKAALRGSVLGKRCHKRRGVRGVLREEMSYVERCPKVRGVLMGEVSYVER